jgi:hypothetical protein
MNPEHQDEKRRVGNAVAILAATCNASPRRAVIEDFIERLYSAIDHDADIVMQALRRLHCSPEFPTIEDVRDACTAVIAGHRENEH